MDDLGVPPFQETSIKASTWSFLVVSRRSNQPGTCFENGSGLHGLEKHPVTSMMLQFETPFIICYWLVVFRHPSEKSWSSSVGVTIPNWMESHKSHVPNHQPGYNYRNSQPCLMTKIRAWHGSHRISIRLMDWWLNHECPAIFCWLNMVNPSFLPCINRI